MANWPHRNRGSARHRSWRPSRPCALRSCRRVEALVAYEDVWVDGDGGPILVGIAAALPARGITVLVGPSGAGKSTLLRLANRLEVPSRGRVLVDGIDAASLDPLALRRRIGMVFQRPTTFPGSVRENLLVADPSLDADGAVALLDRAALP